MSPPNAPAAAGIIGRHKKHRRSNRRTAAVTNPQPTTPILITAADAALAVVTITFDQPVSLSGVPAYTTDLPGITALSAAITTPTTIEVTFSADVSTATAINIPYEEPAIRNTSGGFVANSTFPV
jgi:hypothetical protein